MFQVYRVILHYKVIIKSIQILKKFSKKSHKIPHPGECSILEGLMSSRFDSSRWVVSPMQKLGKMVLELPGTLLYRFNWGKFT